MDHKAYAFDYAGFQRRLAPILYAALETGDAGPLRAFIEANRAELTDPYEGEPLEELPDGDVHELGDFALTAFYDPACDIGLADDWEEAGDAALGVPFGPPSNLFDPGRMGSYFQSPELVERNRRTATDEGARQMLAETDAGLYLTF